MCFATLAAEYISLTESFPIHGDAFILSERPDRKHDMRLWGLSSERLAKCMRVVMSSAGIPEDFKKFVTNLMPTNTPFFRAVDLRPTAIPVQLHR